MQVRCLICLPNDGHAGDASHIAQTSTDVADKTYHEYDVGPCGVKGALLQSCTMYVV